MWGVLGYSFLRIRDLARTSTQQARKNIGGIQLRRGKSRNFMFQIAKNTGGYPRYVRKTTERATVSLATRPGRLRLRHLLQSHKGFRPVIYGLRRPPAVRVQARSKKTITWHRIDERYRWDDSGSQAGLMKSIWSVALHVSDVEKSKRFYDPPQSRRILGIVPILLRQDGPDESDLLTYQKRMSAFSCCQLSPRMLTNPCGCTP